MEQDVIFVGQAFNREFGTKVKERLAGRSAEVGERFVSHYALTGKAGTFIGRLLDMSRLEFCANFRRTNLNVHFTGKIGKGDAFDSEEGLARALALLKEDGLRRYVLVGGAVAECFSALAGPVHRAGRDWIPLAWLERGDKSFFCLPHPSGINRWWNNRQNMADAQRRLKGFLWPKT